MSIPICTINLFYIFFQKKEDTDSIILEGVFQSPFAYLLPNIVPKESHFAHFQVLLPKKWPFKNFKPMCIHMAGTGDHVNTFE